MTLHNFMLDLAKTSASRFQSFVYCLILIVLEFVQHCVEFIRQDKSHLSLVSGLEYELSLVILDNFILAILTLLTVKYKY